MKIRNLALAALTAGVLSACGGGNTSAPAPVPMPPTSVTGDTFTDAVNDVAAVNSESVTPQMIEAVSITEPENTEPFVLK